MRSVMNTIVEHMSDQQTSGVHTEVLNSTTNYSLNPIPDEVRRNELDFQIGCTTSTHTSCSLLSFNYSRQTYNDDNSNKKTHETSDNEENDGHSNQDSTVNCRRYLKRNSNETSSCA